MNHPAPARPPRAPVPTPPTIKAQFDAKARRLRRALALARARARRPVPGADGLLPDFDDPKNLISPAEVRASIEFERKLAEAEKPRGKKS